jgi:arylformamidase
MRTHIQPDPPLDYRNQAAVPEFQDYFDTWKRESERVRRSLSCELDVRYGPGVRNVCDVFPAGGRGAPVFILIHGGWWYFLDKSDFSYIAPPFVERGSVVVSLNYPLAPAARIGEIVAAVREAVIWVRSNISRWGGDPGNISVGGHSAGGHLSTMLAFTDWAARGLSANPLRANCTVSGLYDLLPILQAPHNDRIRMATLAAEQNSPIDMVERNPVRHIACVGKSETSGFLWQHNLLLEVCAARGVPVVDASIEGKNHFSVIDELARPESAVFQALWREMTSAAR